MPILAFLTDTLFELTADEEVCLQVLKTLPEDRRKALRDIILTIGNEQNKVPTNTSTLMWLMKSLYEITATEETCMMRLKGLSGRKRQLLKEILLMVKDRINKNNGGDLTEEVVEEPRDELLMEVRRTRGEMEEAMRALHKETKNNMRKKEEQIIQMQNEITDLQRDKQQISMKQEDQETELQNEATQQEDQAAQQQKEATELQKSRQQTSVEQEYQVTRLREEVNQLQRAMQEASKKQEDQVAELERKINDFQIRMRKDITELQATMLRTSSKQKGIEKDLTSLKSNTNAIKSVCRVIFSVDLSKNVSVSTTIPYDTGCCNIGNGYDFNTGVFTAPVDGTYLFTITTKVERATERTGLLIMKNIEVLKRVEVWEDKYAEYEWEIRLEHNDTVMINVDVRPGGRLYVCEGSQFTGRLLH